jgi:nucleoside-diphosphate-sugar epimerase
MTRVLVTNVDTPFGEALVSALLAEPTIDLVIGWCSKRRLSSASQPDPRLRYEALDVHHDRELWRALYGLARELGVDCVIHDPIALRAGHEPALTWHKVTEESRRLLLHCSEHPTIRHFVLRSSADVYRVAPNLPLLIREDHPLDMAASSARVRNLVEIDLYSCSRMSERGLKIAVLRCCELLGAGLGSELFDYLCAPVCLRPLGFDPMLGLLSMADAARAFVSSALRGVDGVINISGLDVLPLSRLTALAGRRSLALPGTLLSPLYLVRAWTTGAAFRYPGYASRFHHAGVLDGRHALQTLGYEPRQRIDFAQLAADAALHERSVSKRSLRGTDRAE